MNNFYDEDRDLIRMAYLNSLEMFLERVPNQVIRVSLEDELLFNPSIVCIDGGYLVNARSSNAVLVRDGRLPDGFELDKLVNHNFLLTYDREMNLISSVRLDDSRTRVLLNENYHGLEDIRLFKFGGRIHGIATLVSIQPQQGWKGYVAHQVTFELIDACVVSPKIWGRLDNKKIEKNWTPLVKDDVFYIAYLLNPLALMRVEGGRGNFVKGNPRLPLQISGGTPFVRVGEVFVSMAHFPRMRVGEKLYYRHCFIVMNDSFEVIEMSDPFFIQRRGVEFACGLDVDGDDLLLSYGVGDRAAFIARFPIHVLRKYLVSV